ncbi:ROK family protein [Ligilactobacillus agilis]|uniref:ROK family protein n=1 Tax=Ligilactobacillus agilis TaxID=1601 RepID=UPI00255C4D76|nr:ROK family protein [Ligilactobacillus agilis]
MVKNYVAVDLGGTTIKFAIIDELGKIIKKWHIKTDVSDNGKNIPQDIVDTIKAEANDVEVSGVGIGVPGPISADGRSVVRAVNLGWGLTPLSDFIQKQLQVPVLLVNDANAAALGEMWQGAAQGKKNIVFVTLGTGVGGGIILNKRIINGVHSSGGEIGHIPVESDEHRVCGCGNINCLETFSSANGMVKTMQKILADNGEERGDFTTVDIFEWLKKGDELAQQALDITVDKLGRAIASIMNTVDAEEVVIGGGLSAAGAPLLLPLKDVIDKHIFPEIRGNYHLKQATLGNDAGAFGAIAGFVVDD